MKRNFKRVLSLVLSIAMVFTLIPLGTVWVSAAEYKAASTTFNDLIFYVPEAIYLYPNGSSDISATATKFQWYINNNSDGSVKSGYDTTGYIYYSYAKATNTTLSYRFVDRYMSSALTGGSVSLSTTSPGTGTTISITDGTSPSLNSDVYGCYIEWILSFTDSTDNKAKIAYAYTYVYKPYILPVGGFNRVKNSDGSSHYCQSATWMTGVHSITVGTLHDDGGYYPKRNTEYGFGGFITKGSTSYVGSSSYTAGLGSRQNDCYNEATKYSGADKWNLAFINTGSTASSYIKTNPNNKGATNYGKTASGSDTYGLRSIDYWYKEKSAYNVLSALYSAASGNIYIDTSRYSDLSQIPNLGIACMLTDNEGSKWGCWYIADATDVSSYRETTAQDGADNCRKYWNGKSYIIAGVGTSATNDSSTDSWDEEGVQYAGPWPRTILGSTGTQGQKYTYSFRSWFSQEEDSTGTNDWAYNTCLVDLNATYYNKANLRAAVNNAIKKMPALGVNGLDGVGKPKSCYFDSSADYKWTDFQTAYQKAVRVLGSVDMKTEISDNPNELATNLNSALAALQTKVFYNGNGGTTSVASSFSFIEIGTAASKSFTPSATATRTGYTFKGWSTSSSGTAKSPITVGYNNTIYAVWQINSSTLKVNPNGGSWNGSTSEQSFTQNYNTNKSIPVPTRTGYTFTGWTRSGTNGSMSSTTAAATYTFGPTNAATDTITAQWSINSYKLDVNWDYTDGNGTVSVADANTAGYATVNVYSPKDSTSTYTGGSGVGDFWQDVQYNQTWKMVATVKDSSKYTLKNGTTYNSTETRTGTMGTGNHGEVFHIMPVYNIAFNANNGSGSMSNIERIPYDKAQTLTSNSFIRTGYTFTGWNTKADGTGTNYSNGASVSELTSTAGGTVTLYAQWTEDQFTLRYNGNEPEGRTGQAKGIPADQKLTYDTSATFGGPPMLTGYIFNWWCKDTAGTANVGGPGGQIDVNSFYNTTGVGKGGIFNVYAKWTPITYTVSYNGNGSTSGSTASSTHTYDKASALTSNGFTKTGYSFAGWAESATGKVIYGDKEEVTNLASTQNANVTLYAKWTANTITVTFNGNNSTSGSMTSQEFTYDVEQALKANAFERKYTVTYNYNGADGGTEPANATASYTFNGWNSLAAGNGDYTYTNGQTVKNPCGVSSGSATLYAQWTGGTVTLPSPTKTGYSFEGWYTKPDFSGNVYAKGATYTATSATTFYAKWKANTIELSYDGNGHTGGTVPAKSTFTYGTTVHTANALTKEIIVSFEYNGADGGNSAESLKSSYTFNGWKSSTGSKKIYAANTDVTDNFEAGNANVVQLTAQWDNSAAGVILPTPSRTGYTFDGWFDNSSFNGTKYAAGASYTPAANVKMYAKWVANSFSLYYNSNGKTVKSGTMPSTNAFTLVYDTDYYASNGLISSLIPKATNQIFIGWNTKADGLGTAYYPNTNAVKNIVNALYKTAGNKSGGTVTLYAQWKDVSEIDPKSATHDEKTDETEPIIKNEPVSVFTGLKFDGNNWDPQYENLDVTYDTKAFSAYEVAAVNYYNAKETISSNVTESTVSDFVSKANTLDTNIKALEKTLHDVYKNIFDNGFEISYAQGQTEKKGLKSGENIKVTQMNLNHYKPEAITKASNALNGGTAFLAKGNVKVTEQNTLNNYVKAMAEAYVAKDTRETNAPEYKVYETKNAIQNFSGDNVTAVNYVYSGKGNYTYYCYTNVANPTVEIAVNDTGSNVSYPTRSSIVSAVVKDSNGNIVSNPASSDKNLPTADSVRTVKKVIDNPYAGISVGKEYIGEINGQTYKGDEYYNKQSVIKLSPKLTEDKQEAIYTITSTDDNYDENVADKSALSNGIGGANTASDIQTISGNNTAVTPEGTITVVICYNDNSGFDVTGDQTETDKWLSQFHLYRSAGTANNWELIKHNDTVYTIDDPSYGQLGQASFTYTYELGRNGINTTDPQAVKAYLTKTVGDVDNYYYKQIVSDTFTGTNKNGEGLGYIPWDISGSGGWSFNYYPKAGAYTYVHLVDRWGNVVDKVIHVPECLDSAVPKAEVPPENGFISVSENGGSGIDTISLNAKSVEIIPDENSTLEGKVYTTSGDSVIVYTGEPNKSYSFTCTDAAGNKLSTTVKSDEEGYITISVEDSSYIFEGESLKFALNDIEINLYDGISKKIKSVENAEVEEGERAYFNVVTCDSADFVQLVDENGNTTTLSNSTTYEDGKKTWEFSKKLSAGEHVYKVRVKINNEWFEEGQSTTIVVNEKAAPNQSLVTNVEYDPAVGIKNTYRVTVTDRANMLQFIELSHGDGTGTRSFDRYSDQVVITSYNADGEEVDSMSREFAYEIWSVTTNLNDGRIGVRVKERGSSKWESTSLAYKFVNTPAEVNSALVSSSLQSESGKTGPVYFTVVAGSDAQYVQLRNDAGGTTTISAEKAVDNGDGTLTFKGKVWFNHSGINTATVRVLDVYGWHDGTVLTYNAEN